MLMIRSAMPFTSTSLRIQAKTCSEQSRDAPTPLPIPSYMGSNPLHLAPQKHGVCNPKQSKPHRAWTCCLGWAVASFSQHPKVKKKSYLFIPLTVGRYRRVSASLAAESHGRIGSLTAALPKPTSNNTWGVQGSPTTQTAPAPRLCSEETSLPGPGSGQSSAAPARPRHTASLCPAGPAAARDPAPRRSSAG